MQEGDKAEHGGHAAPLVTGQALAQRNTRRGLNDRVHSSPGGNG